MKKLILSMSIFILSQPAFAMHKSFKCMFEFSKAAGVAVADTLPVTSAVVDDFVDDGQRQSGDDVLQSMAELLGGGLTLALEVGIWFGAAYATQGQLAFIPNLGATAVPYRSTRLQWQLAKLNCDRAK